MRSSSPSDESAPPRAPERNSANDDATEALQEGLKQCFLTPPATSSSILTPPSSVGPEDCVEPFSTREDVLNEPYYDPAFQSAIQSAAGTARDIAEVLKECPRPEPTIATLTQDAISLSSYRSPPSRLIGLIGHSGQGKSSLINSLLDVEDLAVTGEDGNAVTAIVIEYRDKKESQSSRFLIEASCLKPQEIDEQLEEFLHQYRQPFISPCEEHTPGDYEAIEKRSETAERIFEAAFSSFDGFKVASFRDQDFQTSLSVLRAHAKQLRWPRDMRDGEWSCAAQTPNECHELMKTFMENGTWPFITSMSVHFDSKLLRSGIVLADLPGYHDVNYARVRNTQRYQLSCDELFVVADIKRAIDDPIIKEAIKSHTRSADGVGEVALPNVTVVCTHSAVFSKSPRAVTNPRNAKMVKQAMAKIKSLENQNLGTGLQTRRILDEANLALDSIFVQERNENVKQALQKAYATDCGPSTLQVYCVDNLLYHHPDSLLAHAVSGIPFLRQHTLSLPGKALFRFGDFFLRSHVPALVLSLQMWLEAIKCQQKCALSGDVVLEEWFSEFDTAVDDLEDNVATAYKKSIKKPLRDRQQEVISQALDVCHSWGSMNHTSFRAFIGMRGTHYTHRVRYRCWNTELVECLNAVTAVRWAKLDQTIMDTFQSLAALAEQEFESMTKELNNVKAPASLLKSFVHRKRQVREVLEANCEDFMRNFRFVKQLATTGGSGSYILEYMNPIYSQCHRDSGTGVTDRNKGRLISHIRQPEFVTSQVHWALQALQYYAGVVTEKISRDVTAIVSSIKADLKLLDSPSKTLVKKHPEYVQRLRDTLDDARKVAEEIEKGVESARAEAKNRGYIS